MDFFAWRCSKSDQKTSGKKIHLYLPGGQRLVGDFNGRGKLSIDEAFERTSAGTQFRIDPDRCKWIQHAGGRELDVFMAVAGQLIFGLEDRSEVFEGGNYDELARSIKMVHDDAFDPGDTFETLPVSRFSMLGQTFGGDRQPSPTFTATS